MSKDQVPQQENSHSRPVNLDVIVAAFNDIDVPIALYDSKWNLLEINDAAINLYGITDKQKLFDLGLRMDMDPNFKPNLLTDGIAYKDVNTHYYYDFDQVEKKYPGLTSRKGTLHLLIKLKPIFDKKGVIQYIIATSSDYSSLAKEREAVEYLKDEMSFMLNAEGLSVWVYDIESGNRVLHSGSHLFPTIKTMNEFMDIVHPGDLSMLNYIIGQLIRGNKTEGKAEIRVRNVSEYIYLEILCMPRFKDGKIAAITFLTKDTSLQAHYQKELQVKDDKLRRSNEAVSATNLMMNTLINRMPCIFFAKDADNNFRYIMANQLFCDKVGKHISEILRHSDYDIIDNSDEVEHFRRNDKETLTKGFLHIRETTNWHGELKVWQTTKYHIKSDTGKNLIIGLSQDITQLDKAYSELKIAKEEAERSNVLKDAFLANISHEIRTPLNAIIGFASLLPEAQTEERKKDFIQRITVSGQLLIDIIEKILTISQLDAGYFNSQKETFELSELFSELINNHKEDVASNIQLVTNCPYEKCSITADRLNLAKILKFFIQNAIKYTSHGYITIGADIPKEKNGVNLYVKDTGIGFNEEAISKIFERFEKIDTFIPGVGLGLPICKLLTDRLGGKISVESSLGKGSKFSIWIPCEVKAYKI